MKELFLLFLGWVGMLYIIKEYLKSNKIVPKDHHDSVLFVAGILYVLYFTNAL